MAAHELLGMDLGGRTEFLREADLVLLAGVPCDFRLGYGRSIPRRARLVAANRSADDLALNRRPAIGSKLNIARGLNRLWNQGGIQYAPPVR